MNLDHLTNETPAPVDLSRLKAMTDEFKRLESEVEKLTETLKEKEKILARLGMEDIPQFLAAAGLSECKLPTGEKIKVKPEVSVSISDAVKFAEFLKARGEDDILKTSVAFDKMTTEQRDQVFGFLSASGVGYNAENKVHPSTLKKYFRDLLGVSEPDNREAGIHLGAMVHADAVAAFANVFTYFKTTIK